MTIDQHVATARSRLLGAGLDPAEARMDAELLARHVLRWDRATFAVRRREEPPAAFRSCYARLIARRAGREPTAFIVGVREFWGLDFEVSRDTLIPRPETELIVERVLAAFAGRRPPLTIVDAGTGSGCLAVALAREFDAATIVATDLSERALAVARGNARRHGVDDRVSCRRGDLLDGITTRVDLVVSNPPYVPTGDAASLPPEVLDYEPPDALFAGRDGLRVIRRLVLQAGHGLGDRGVLAFEIGAGQRDATAGLLARTPRLSTPIFYPDLQGIPRVAVATCRPDAEGAAHG